MGDEPQRFAKEHVDGVLKEDGFYLLTVVTGNGDYEVKMRPENTFGDVIVVVLGEMFQTEPPARAYRLTDSRGRTLDTRQTLRASTAKPGSVYWLMRSATGRRI